MQKIKFYCLFSIDKSIKINILWNFQSPISLKIPKPSVTLWENRCEIADKNVEGMDLFVDDSIGIFTMFFIFCYNPLVNVAFKKQQQCQVSSNQQLLILNQKS
jgi:hypothetical protein